VGATVDKSYSVSLQIPICKSLAPIKQKVYRKNLKLGAYAVSKRYYVASLTSG